MILLLFVLALVRSELLYGFQWLNFTFESSSDAEYYEGNKTYEYCIPKGIKADSKGNIYISIPRNSSTVPATLTKIVRKGGLQLLEPFPSWSQNDYDSPDGFKSVTALEIDLQDNFWVVDQGSGYLLALDPSGTIISRFRLNVTSQSSLESISIDLDRNFSYISDSGRPGIIVVDLNANTSRLVLENHDSVVPDPSFLLTVNGTRVAYNTAWGLGVSGIALSCDKRDLYYCPINSRNLYTISTQYIRNATIADYAKYVVDLGYKTTATQGMILSEKEDLYLGNLQESNVLYYGQIMPYADYFLVYFLQQISNDTYIWPCSLGFNNANRTLLVLDNQLQNFYSNSINFTNPLHGNYNFWVYEVNADDRSYLYGCRDVIISNNSPIATPVWIFALISIMSLIAITIIVCAIKHYRMVKKRRGALIYN